MSTIPLTKRGADKLRDELQRLKSIERPAVINSIAEARAQGDLSENAEYDAAKEKQGFIEGRIADIESKLAAAQIIDPAALDADGRIVFAATVQLEDLNSGDIVTYQIVGDDEADIDHGLISVSSPIARALIGKLKAMSRPCRRRAACASTKSSLCATSDGRTNVSLAPHRIFRLLTVIWVGSLLTIGYVVAPTLFTTLTALRQVRWRPNFFASRR